MRNITLITEDEELLRKIRTVSGKVKQFRDLAAFKPRGETLLIDLDSLDPEKLAATMTTLQRGNNIVIAIYSRLEPQIFENLLQKGVLAFIFRERIPSALRSQLGKAEKIGMLRDKIKAGLMMEQKMREFIDNLDLLNSEEEFESKLNRIFRSFKKVLDLEQIAFYFLCNDGCFRRKIASRGLQTLLPREIDLKRSTRIADRALNDGIISTDLLTGRKLLKEQATLDAVVLRKKQDIFGILLYERDKKSWKSPDGRLLKSFLTLIVSLLNNYRILQYFLMSQEKIINQEKANLLSQMYLCLNHELKNPLTVISLETELMQMSLLKKSDAGLISKRLANIENSIERIKNTLENLGNLKSDRINLQDYLDGKKMVNLQYEN